jgi:hypothetical protein
MVCFLLFAHESYHKAGCFGVQHGVFMDANGAIIKILTLNFRNLMSFDMSGFYSGKGHYCKISLEIKALDW